VQLKKKHNIILIRQKHITSRF